MKILFYTPLNTRSRDIESQAAEFQKNGHRIFLLTQSPYHVLHENFRSYGYTVGNSNVKSSKNHYRNLLRRIVEFVRYCRRNKIDIVYSHLEPANLVAVLGQFFLRAKIIVCRHHIDYARLSGFDQDLSYRATYRLARNIVVVSTRAKEYMVLHEGVAAKKIHKIDLCYDFALYGKPNENTVREIRSRFKADVLLLTVCRLDNHKRPEQAIEVVRKLKNEGVDIKLLILGAGERMDALRSIVSEYKLGNDVHFAGYVENVLDYMAAADFLVHPSISESSCISLKEAALVSLPVVVCKGVGDFDEIVNPGQNGMLVEKDQFAECASHIVKDYLKDKETFRKMGEKLRTDILERFDIRNVSSIYEKLFHK